jgi:hypothetical protein|tara:strand:+ start:9317 stop:9649 length:333 start_codon:yes stop_codon:yes gene_type:complete
MAASFYIKQNDTAPSIEVALKDSNGRVKSMANASLVKFHMKLDDGIVAIDGGTGTIVNATKGIVAYEWASGDTSNTGIHSAEFQIEYNNGQIETFPNTGYIKVIIKDELA